MNKLFKNILLPALAVAVLPLMSACSEDRDSNPTMQEPTEFHLNTPAIALGDNTYDLARAATVNLTCSQPDYGYTAQTIYQVQVSIDDRFASTDADDVAYKTLATTYSSANMNVDGVELNNAVVKLYQSAHQGADPSGITMPVYIRLRAHVQNGPDYSYINSNVITLPKTQVSYVAATPKTMFLKGSSIRGGQESKELGGVYGAAGEFYGIVYMAANSTLFHGDDEAAADGFANTTLDDQAKAGLSAGADGGIQFANAGWYTIHLVAVVDAAQNKVNTTIHVYPAHAYVIGAVAGGAWNDGDKAWELTAPTGAPAALGSFDWVSPAFAGGGELRAYIKIPGYDWWKTEFTIFKEKLYYRDVNIVDNWAKNKGSEYSVTCSAGDKLYINFDYDHAKVGK